MQSENDLLREKLKAKSREVKRLRAALRALAPESDSHSESDDKDQEDAEQHEGMLASSADEGDIDEDEEVEPAWDTEGFYRCGKCSWEIVEGWCIKCVKKYSQLYEEDERHPNSGSHVSLPGDDTYYDTLESCQTTVPRGTTPPPDVDAALLRPDTIAFGFKDRVEEYKALLSRGATRIMCETFDLEFTQDQGILMNMDEYLVEEWAGPEMESCVSWKVCLGREVRLDTEDVDGSIYIEEHLEEVLLFGMRSEGGLQWETVELSPGTWITKPIITTDVAEQAAEASSAPAAAAEVEVEDHLADVYQASLNAEYASQMGRNEYEELSDDSEDDSEDADGRIQLAPDEEDWDSDEEDWDMDHTSDLSDSSSSASSEYGSGDDYDTESEEDEQTVAGISQVPDKAVEVNGAASGN